MNDLLQWNLGDVKPTKDGLYSLLFESNTLTVGFYTVDKDEWLISKNMPHSAIVCWLWIPDPKVQMVDRDSAIYHQLMAKGVDPIAARLKAAKDQQENIDKNTAVVKDEIKDKKKPWANTIRVKPDRKKKP